MKRREFLSASLAALGTAALTRAADQNQPPAPQQPTLDFDPNDWASIRRQFDLPRDKALLSGFFLANVPRVVRAEIERHRAGLDGNPFEYFHDHAGEGTRNVRRLAARYMDVAENEIALTDSTTMGISLLYSGLRLGPDDEILTTEHDHWCTLGALQLRARHTGCQPPRPLHLYDDGASASVDEIVSTIRNAISPRTRVLALTWVHSCTGVKLPLKEISAVVRAANAQRPEDERILLCVDGVHGFGIENATIPELGCDFFAAGTHKWMLGPRGTGVLWGCAAAWECVDPIIVPFGDMDKVGGMRTPGGFHSFENRWAVNAAFQFHLDIGKARIAERLLRLNALIRTGLAEMSHVTLHTPLKPELSAGIACFEVRNQEVKETVSRLTQRGIIASESPYNPSYARLAACIWNTEAEVDRALAEVRRLA